MPDFQLEARSDLSQGRAAEVFRWIGLLAALGMLALAAYNTYL
ncbi:hypothetical protein [Microvirga pudoricolor]|nr:hypothetical protein [Microvirga pudoricolor]